MGSKFNPKDEFVNVNRIKNPKDPKPKKHGATLICPKCQWVQHCSVPPGRKSIQCCFCQTEFKVKELIRLKKLIPEKKDERKPIHRERTTKRPKS